jgi:hypothetical protein
VARGIEGLLALASLDLAGWTTCPDLTATLTTTACSEPCRKFVLHESVVGTTGPTSMSAVPSEPDMAPTTPVEIDPERQKARFQRKPGCSMITVADPTGSAHALRGKH